MKAQIDWATSNIALTLQCDCGHTHVVQSVGANGFACHLCGEKAVLPREIDLPAGSPSWPAHTNSEEVQDLIPMRSQAYLELIKDIHVCVLPYVKGVSSADWCRLEDALSNVIEDDKVERLERWPMVRVRS